MKNWTSDRYGIEFIGSKRVFYITNQDLQSSTLLEWLQVFKKMNLSKEATDEFKELYQEKTYEGVS